MARDAERRGRPAVAPPDVDIVFGDAIEALEALERCLVAAGRPAWPISRQRDGLRGLYARWRETGEVAPDVG